MANSSDGNGAPSRRSPAGERLDSWKAIAAHFNRDVTTVQRWERQEGLPVRRHAHNKRGSVQAYTSELDQWWESRRASGGSLAATRAPRWRRGVVLASALAALLLAGVIGARGTLLWRAVPAANARVPSSPARPGAAEEQVRTLLERARYHRDQFTPDGVRKAVVAAEEAVRLAPDSAAAHAEVAITHMWAMARSGEAPRVHIDKAFAAAERAAQLDASLAETQTALGLVRELQRDWAGALEAFRHAVARAPNDGQLRTWYALALATQGRFEEAFREAAEAERLAPLSLPVRVQTGWIYLWAGRMEEAMERWRLALDRDPNFPLAHYNMGVGYARLGLHHQAIAEFRRALELVPDRIAYIAQLAVAHARAGDRREARRLLEILEERARREYVAPLQLAEIHCALGDTETALRLLARAEESGALDLVRLHFLARDRYPELSGDERFEAMLRRLTPPGTLAGDRR